MSGIGLPSYTSWALSSDVIKSLFSFNFLTSCQALVFIVGGPLSRISVLIMSGRSTGSGCVTDFSVVGLEDTTFT